MCKHEQKNCPRCGADFECKVGDVTNCQCYGIELSVEEEAFITKQFADCLCRNCLLQLKSRHTLFVEQKDLYSNR
ncbi:cysteine-rich CWC family protein [Lacibacter sp. H375]|uniref:cysteine-rich CWC family protein n=1 Tax=Lacibacter sp. H375 TaxID=3133424 RepID=UPI0030C3BB7E